MFERYLTDALTTHFGHFVENLDADKIRISAWSGELVLKDLSLKPNALDYLMPDCPVELAHGSVGNLEIRIPWSLFRSQLKFGGRQAPSSHYLSTTAPCSIILSDVNILITPRRRTNDDFREEDEESDEDNLKMSIDERRTQREKEVQSLLDGHLLRRVTESTGGVGASLSSTSSSSSRWGWVRDWLSTLLSTLSVTVRNIHIRYEDPGTCLGLVWDGRTSHSISMKVPQSPRSSLPQYRPSFAVGITLRQLSVQSDEISESSSSLSATATGAAAVSQVKKGGAKDGAKDETISSTVPLSPDVKPSDYCISRKKLASAERLAVYWDSGCNLMAIHADILSREQQGMDVRAYFQSAFAVINTTIAMSTTTSAIDSFKHRALYSHQHSYVLDPISPSIKLNLVSRRDRAIRANENGSTNEPLDEEVDNSSNDGSTIVDEPQHIGSVPPSTIQLHLPPCKFTLDRSTLEDTAYVRKSLSVWRHSKKGVLSEATLRRLAKLRPVRSPALDPKSWWRYAVEASLTLSQVNRAGGHFVRAKNREPSRRSGWKSFWTAFQRRNRYVELYQCLAPSENRVDSLVNYSDPDMIHSNLLEMEDRLTLEEIVAFRLAVYESWQSPPKVTSSIEQQYGGQQSSNKLWAIWTSKPTENNPDALQYSGPILSLKHRVAMMHEMSLALEREKNNAIKSARANNMRQMSMTTIPAAIDQHTDMTIAIRPLLWKAAVSCTEIAVQINDKSLESSADESMHRTPVIRFSCAWLQEQRWFEDDSWDIDCILASLVVKDLTVSSGSLSQRHFPNLIAEKSSFYEKTGDTTEFVLIEGQPHRKSISIAVQRRLHWSRGVDDELLRNSDRGSTTTNRISILPMEVVYSTVPVEVATRVLGTVKTPELVDDYHRMAAAAHGWQQRQKKKIMAALAHKRKKIIVDVDVGAPEFLIPENINRADSPMLAIDLGRLRLVNDEPSADCPTNYDDHWRFIMSDIQVRSANVAAFAQDTSQIQPPVEAVAYRQLLEPFSLNFAIATRIASEESHDQEDKTKIRVGAILPRLVVNLNSSSIRLMSRLQSQFEHRRKWSRNGFVMEGHSRTEQHIPPHKLFLPSFNETSNPQEFSSVEEGHTSRNIQFDFTAPVISLMLGSDTGDIPKSSAFSSDEVTLLDISFHGIRGSLMQTVSSRGESTLLFDAKLHSVNATDLFQTAGNDFALLLSSSQTMGAYEHASYSETQGNPNRSALDWNEKDLVAIQYKSCSTNAPHSAPIPNKLSIRFHELFVEWNPETFATIQKAVRMPREEKTGQSLFFKNTLGEDEFFDAVEHVSLATADDGSVRLVSEVASSSFETADSEGNLDDSAHTRQSSFSHSVLSLARSLSTGSALSPSRRLHPSVAPLSPHTSAYRQIADALDTESDVNTVQDQPIMQGFELIFELSKLRVSFNKESRHRKVIIAQMDGTSVSYASRKLGGSMTKMNIGNLVFTDPTSIRNATLYGEILGLKNKATTSVNTSSLLEMEILINPTSRSYSEGLNSEHDDPEQPVSIDLNDGVVNGSNNFFKARFSPMRFVFLEQLWFEFIDYFFEGIIGTSVWSGRNSSVPAVLHLHKSTFSESRYAFGADAKGLNFTRFLIQMESPEVLFPVTYQSPHFLRLDLEGIRIANRYNTSAIGDPDHDTDFRIQWFNNCTIALQKLRLYSWTGRELGKSPVVTTMALRWPTGPGAPLVTPKWNVKCDFETLHIALRRSDYALVQHIISNNIGEPSRHLDEWEALQTLSPMDFLAYTSSILVHFGYDKKDVTPTTYDLKICIPSLSVDFITGDDDSTADTVAVARCTNLSWILRKDSDLVVNQRATFDVDLLTPNADGISDKLLSSWKYDRNPTAQTSDVEDLTPHLTYTSTTMPDGENIKTLEIVDATIYSNISRWRCFAGFFSGLPEPPLFNKEEIGRLIQVGDRWYKIGSAQPGHMKYPLPHRSSTAEFPWIATRKATQRIFSDEKEIFHISRKSHVAPSFQLRITLRAPQIVLSSDSSCSTKSYLVLRMSHLDFLHLNSCLHGMLTKSVFFDEVEVYTLSTASESKRTSSTGGGSLIHPWSICGTIDQYKSNSSEDCKEHCTVISAGILKAMAAYSDIAVALEVCLSVAYSAKSSQHSSDTPLKADRQKTVVPPSSIVQSDEADALLLAPFETRFHADCEGFELLVADDSGRHFASNQDLITLSLGRILFSRLEATGRPSAMHLRVESFDLYDDLQLDSSPFKTAATTRFDMVWTDAGVAASKENTDELHLPRKYTWKDFEMKKDGRFRFASSPALKQRLDEVSLCCLRLEEGTISDRRMAVHLSRLVDETKSQKYLIKLQSLSVQYNPSTVIAIQRFMGRLWKESKQKMTSVFEDEVGSLESNKSDLQYHETRDVSESETPSVSTVDALVELGALTLCLNKEHQNRRLLQLKLSSCRLGLQSSLHGMSFSAIVGSLNAWDPDTYSNGIDESNRQLVRIIKSSRNQQGAEDQYFLKLQYNTFSGRDKAKEEGLLPAWVRKHIHKTGGIDDFLSVRVASTQFVFIKERTEELIDYLSNGLPGKGMGVTSRAAKGFISKRILTRSFLEFQNDSPQVFVPHHELSAHGISLKLGDVVVRSYFEQDALAASDHDEWWRILTLQLSGFQFGVRSDAVFFEVTTPIDLSVNLKRPTSRGGDVSIRGGLSLVDLTLDYSRYVLIRNVTRDNLGRKVDTDKWDNVEKAYESEAQIGDFVTLAAGEADSHVPANEGRVAYSTNARFIRYGKGGKRKSKLERQDSLISHGSGGQYPSPNPQTPSTCDLKFTLDGLSLKLCRDDPVEALAVNSDLPSEFRYAIILLRVQIVEVSLNSSENGELSLHLSLFRLGLFDMGDAGRRLREYYISHSQVERRLKPPRRPCAFCVIAEGYAPGGSSGGNSRSEHNPEEPQLVVTIEQRKTPSALATGSIVDLELPPNAKVTIARVVVNYLSLNMMLRPVKEAVSFLSCEWPSGVGKTKSSDGIGDFDVVRKLTPLHQPNEGVKSDALQLTLVAHYPRIFFLADECDEHSRALVLRGLAVVNFNKVTTADGGDVQHDLSSNAQLHSLESYINPDVQHALSFKKEHVQIVGSQNVGSFPDPSESVDVLDQGEGSLGVALIQPVTAGLEYSESRRELYPTKRSIFVNVEPVSTMLSFEDLNLIETVASRLSSSRSKREGKQNVGSDSAHRGLSSPPLAERIARVDQGGSVDTVYEVIFETRRLGLGLKTVEGQTAVNSIQNEEYDDVIDVGDVLLSIGGFDCAGCTLNEIVKRLAGSGRPVTLQFRSYNLGLTKWPELRGRTTNKNDYDRGSDAEDHNHKAEFSVDSVVIKMRKGVPNGLRLERSICGALPVVSKIYPEFVKAAMQSTVGLENRNEFESRIRPDIRFPRAGAIVAAIDGVPLAQIGLEEAWRILASIENDASSDDGNVGRDSDKTYDLTFLEIDSKLWGTVECFNFSSSGFALSFIDDLHGRDMPLFCWKLDSLELRAERGIGGRAQMIEVQVPAILRISSTSTTKVGSSVVLTHQDLDHIRTESVISLSAVATCSMDYFHPKVAFWEPLVETSQLFLMLEKQAGNASAGRSGQVAIELSDQLLRDQNFRSGSLSVPSDAPKMVTFNLTDASAEVVVKAASQWKAWRNSKALLFDEEDQDDFEPDLKISSPVLGHGGTSSIGSLSSALKPIAELEPFSGSPEKNHRSGGLRNTKLMATQRAAQAALVFAKKRGAEKSKKSDTAKPFVLRNRTGVSIAFVQEDVQLDRRPRNVRDRNYPSTSVVGEYQGLAQGLAAYTSSTIQELADKEDARFSMEIISAESEDSGARNSTSSVRAALNKVRTYEGRFPSLTVAIQAVSGITIQPLKDLQVFKVGSTVRHLLVRKDKQHEYSEEEDLVEYSIPVVWKVEIEDNRRVLTLSTAVRVVTTAFNSEMEIGMQPILFNDSVEKTLICKSDVMAIGTVRQDRPFYLPLWVALKLEAVNVFVRPKWDGSGNTQYEWGGSSILRFAPLNVNTLSCDLDRQKSWTWVWEETFEELDFIRCDTLDEIGRSLWLAVFSGSSPDGAPTGQHFGLSRRGGSSTIKFHEEEHDEVISVTLDANVTLRNMLPTRIEWQVAQIAYGSSAPDIVDGSTKEAVFEGSDSKAIPRGALYSGECTEIFACDFQSSTLQARFREYGRRNWSDWAPLSLDVSDDCDEATVDGETESQATFPRARQVNVQVSNDSFGVPMTFGVRVLPKLIFRHSGDVSKAQAYGVEIIVYTELWIRNITSLPLNFGCPSAQLHGTEVSTSPLVDENTNRFNAESALMEIASLLEVGDKGTGFDRHGSKGGETVLTFESLPNQECDELWEEVFEYLEIEYSTVKRRWWASENYDNFRMNITQSAESGLWQWINEHWSIDIAGEIDSALGGWESTRSLLSSDGSFSLKRTFDSSHSIRRRRFFRNRSGNKGFASVADAALSKDALYEGGIQVVHQPLHDSFSRERQNIVRTKKRKQKGEGAIRDTVASAASDAPTLISVKCGDGKWSAPATISDAGNSHGVLRLLASRWPGLTSGQKAAVQESSSSDGDYPVTSPFRYEPGNLASKLYELCYSVVDADGDWGEFSKTMTVSPRFMLRNESNRFTIEVKQTGSADASSLRLLPGAFEAFYWEDFRLPGLVSVMPCIEDGKGRSVYKWSGGFDICNLGMIPLRIRREAIEESSHNFPEVKSIRALVEIRPGTGGFGINISFREEDPLGDGALFRIENASPFPVWLSQDGILANPSKYLGQSYVGETSRNFGESGFHEDFEADGDSLRPNEKSVFALDVPYRQGKYAHRKEATFKELLHVRIALAPLAHRSGVETVKVAGLTNVGETLRLNPSKLFGVLDERLRVKLQGIRVLGVVCSDGPTKVVRLSLIKVEDQDLIGKTLREVSYMASKQTTSLDTAPTPREMHARVSEEIKQAAHTAASQFSADEVPTEEQATRLVLHTSIEKQVDESRASETNVSAITRNVDMIYSIRAEFNGFLLSMVDSAPSEIAVATLRSFNALARWNAQRTNEASLILSIGWLQVDNHVPNAPFKVAIRPDASGHRHPDNEVDSDSDCEVDSSPLLMVAVAFAPKHKSEILCIRSVTVAPRNLVIAVDLAFLVRLQRYALGLKTHFRAMTTVDGHNPGGNLAALSLYGEQKRNLPFPPFLSVQEELRRAAAFGAENRKLYFQGLNILPAAITLSVAPARALTPAQATLEGNEVAAIHQAVRKGDVLVGSSSALLGVRVGRTNTTPLAVVRGVFKSIVVDALLRLDGASLQFSGVSLRNHISTGPQLGTYLAAHYLASLRQNVPALLGSLAAFGNPLGLIRGLGDGMSDFVSQPVRGLRKSVKELDPTYLVDGVARGTGSLARHAVGGFADSASLLTETFSKNMAVLTLDRRYAQKRDRSKQLRLNAGTSVTIAGGVESGFAKLVEGFMEGVTGVVKAPMRGAEKKGIEGFAKGIGKGLLGLLVKPMIGISDAATDVMIGVKNSVENTAAGQQQSLTLDRNQFRPRRPMYGRDKVLRPYAIEDAAAAALMLRTRCAGENYLSHLDLGDRVALLSVKRFILLGPKGQELMALKYTHVSKAEVRQIPTEDHSIGWAIIIVLNTPRKNGSEVEVLSCTNQQEAVGLCAHIQRGIDLVASDRIGY